MLKDKVQVLPVWVKRQLYYITKSGVPAYVCGVWFIVLACNGLASFYRNYTRKYRTPHAAAAQRGALAPKIHSRHIQQPALTQRRHPLYTKKHGRDEPYGPPQDADRDTGL
jgi:hypothetical protein